MTSARPGAAGLTEQYTGTMTEVDANNAISSSPVSTTTNAQATLNVSSASATDGSGNVIFTANESDAANLTTLTAQTVSTIAYQTQTNGSVNVRALSTVATESSGVVYANTYAKTNGLLTVLPEVAGSFSNDAADVYNETDPGLGASGGTQGVTTTRTIAGNGTYSQTTNELNIATSALSADTSVENADFSGTLILQSYYPPPSKLIFRSSSGSIDYTFSDANDSAYDSSFSGPSWIPAGLATPSVETDTIATASLDSSCSPSATFTGSPMLITQQLNGGRRDQRNA